MDKAWTKFEGTIVFLYHILVAGCWLLVAGY